MGYQQIVDEISEKSKKVMIEYKKDTRYKLSFLQRFVI